MENEERRGGKVLGAMNNPHDYCLLLKATNYTCGGIHGYRVTLRKLYVAGEK